MESDAGNACAPLFLMDWGQLLNWALYLACKPFIPVLISAQLFCLWEKRADGVCEELHAEGTAAGAYCRALFLLMLPLQLLCALGRHQPVCTSACTLGTCLMSHTGSRALSDLGLGFSLSFGFLWLPSGKCFLTCTWFYYLQRPKGKD